MLGLVGAHKTFGLYKSLRSALNPLADFDKIGDVEADGADVEGTDG